MDYGSSWAEPQAAPPPVHHHHHHLYYAAPPYVHHPDVIQYHQQTQRSSSTASFYFPNPNPNPNHYHTPTHDAPLPSAAGAGALLPPALDPYAPRPHVFHGGYDGPRTVPYSYHGVVPLVVGAAGVGAPSGYYYGGGGEDPHSLAVKEAVRQYGVDPHSYGRVLARSSNGLEPAAPPEIGPLHLHGSMSHLTSEKPKKKGGRKKATKVVQSVYCEVCNIECNTPEVLKTHKRGKKHMKTLQKLQESITANHSEDPKATVERKEISDAEKSKALGEKAKRKAAPASAEELEAKKKRVLEGGAAAEGVKVCAICNVVVNSQKVFEGHIAGQKHAAMVKKLQEQEVAAASEN